MKKFMDLSLAGVVVLALSGCGGSDGGCQNDCYDPEPLELTYFLHAYDGILDRFKGVEDIYYECDSGEEGFTDYDGAFYLIDGDYCVFYDLDETLSYEDDILYMSVTSYGDFAVTDSDYQCDSGLFGSTDFEGAFIFDPLYFSQTSDGDVCGFDF